MPITATSLLRFWDMACSLSLEPLARFVTGGAGARPDHPISGHKWLSIAAVQTAPALHSEIILGWWNRVLLARFTFGTVRMGSSNDRVAAVLATRRFTGDALGWRFRSANELSGVKQE